MDILLGVMFVVVLLFVLYKVNPWFRKKADKGIDSAKRRADSDNDGKPFG